MKIYILGQLNYEGLDIESVYSTKEKALEAVPYNEYLKEDDIHEFDLDPPNEGDIYETYYYCNFDPNAQKEKTWGGPTKLKPSKFVPFQFVHSHRTASQTMGFGKTPEEAEENARKAQLELHPVWQVSNNNIEIHHSHPSTVYKWEEFSGQKGCYAVHEDYNVAKIAVMEYMATGKLSPYLTIIKS